MQVSGSALDATSGRATGQAIVGRYVDLATVTYGRTFCWKEKDCRTVISNIVVLEEIHVR